jgi:hypothetical protein
VGAEASSSENWWLRSYVFTRGCDSGKLHTTAFWLQTVDTVLMVKSEIDPYMLHAKMIQNVWAKRLHFVTGRPWLCPQTNLYQLNLCTPPFCILRYLLAVVWSIHCVGSLDDVICRRAFFLSFISLQGSLFPLSCKSLCYAHHSCFMNCTCPSSHQMLAVLCFPSPLTLWKRTIGRPSP